MCLCVRGFAWFVIQPIVRHYVCQAKDVLCRWRCIGNNIDYKKKKEKDKQIKDGSIWILVPDHIGL